MISECVDSEMWAYHSPSGAGAFFTSSLLAQDGLFVVVLPTFVIFNYFNFVSSRKARFLDHPQVLLNNLIINPLPLHPPDTPYRLRIILHRLTPLHLMGLRKTDPSLPHLILPPRLCLCPLLLLTGPNLIEYLLVFPTLISMSLLVSFIGIFLLYFLTFPQSFFYNVLVSSFALGVQPDVVAD